MSKMKRVSFDSSPSMSYEDARATFKHQKLFQVYLELQQETEAARNKLRAMKQKKLTLQAEVRFLRRRHKFLLENKSSAPEEQVIEKSETTRYRKSKQEKIQMEKEATLCNLPPIYKLNQKGKLYTQKKNALQSPVFDLSQKDDFLATQAYKSKQVRRKNSSQFDSNHKEKKAFVAKDAMTRIRAPAFDLNQISREEEEELQKRCEPFDEQHNDVKSSVCRKRKISWQDPVALRV